MMLSSVPGLISSCLGTMILLLPSADARAIWLPLCLMTPNPFLDRAFRTSRQERTGSLLLDSYFDHFFPSGDSVQLLD